MDVKSIGVAAVGIVAVAAAAALSMRSDHTDERKTPHDGGPGDRDDEPELVRGRLDVNDTSGIGLSPAERSGHARDDEIMRLGLYNLGNTCFMNAVLQALAAVPPVLHWFRKVNSIWKLHKDQRSFTDSLVDVLEKLSSLHSPEYSDPALSPSSVLDKFGSTFAGRNQQDAQEFLTVLMNIVDAEEWAVAWRKRLLCGLTVLTSTPLRSGDGRYAPLPRATLMDSWSVREPLLDSAEFLNPMLGWFATSICCVSCQRATPWRNEQFMSLSVQVQPTIQQSLAKFVQHDVIGDYRCEHPACGASGAVRRARITRLPHVLCLHLQRLQVGAYGMEKRNSFVRFPLVLDMADYVRMGTDSLGKSAVRQRKSPDVRRGGATAAGPGAGAGAPRATGGEDIAGAGKPRGSIPAKRVTGASVGASDAPEAPSAQLRGGSPDTSESTAPPESASGGARAAGAGRAVGGLPQPSPPGGVNPYGLGSDTSTYVLMAVVEHLGGPDSGHYVTRRRAPRHTQDGPAEWIRVSDDVVSSASLTDVLGTSAYMLFYVRRDQAGLAAGRRDHPFWYREQHVEVEELLLQHMAAGARRRMA